MSYLDRLRAALGLGGEAENGAPNPADERSPLEQALVRDLQALLETDDPSAALEPVRYHLRFTGRVQGVGFRYTNVTIGQNLGNTGWVRNLDNGSVDMEIQGEPGRIIHQLDQIHTTYRRLRCRVWIEEANPLPVVPDEKTFTEQY